ncbi:molybdenum cofactor guanylyltransferase MobA [Laribacter hongkongensis]|uniref:molybdenum cofactor guanylyltransferase MobA n=1 Tax=Laribacter hongkongensis TaxID=168471 RepID=UPI0023D964C0|nr:molybdenum cofactor guanylyltransferase MobA [Laribacter hongkongensis]MCG9095221.1 molybdenum cofactor guanylyltransferase [Laribacter hongkongensis]
MVPCYTALILAGGQALRMGGQDKGWIELAGQPLIRRTLASLQQQSLPPGQYVISANRRLADYAALGHPVQPDTLPDFPGPLAGLLAAMQQPACAEATAILMLPVDIISLPEDFAARMLSALDLSTDVAMACDPDRWHPALLALRPTATHGLPAYLAAGGRCIRGWLDTLRVTRVHFSGCFPNLNTPQALAAWQEPTAGS